MILKSGFAVLLVILVLQIGCGGGTASSGTPQVASSEPAAASASQTPSSEPGEPADEAQYESSDDDGGYSEDPGAGSREERMEPEEAPQSDESQYEQSMQSYDESMNESSDEDQYNAEMERQMMEEMNEGMDDPSMYEQTGDPNFGGGATGRPRRTEEEEPKVDPIPKDYLGQAKHAFKNGMENRAHDLLLAHLVVEPELAKATYAQAGWSEHLRKPMWGLKIGLGINNAAVKHEGKLHPPRPNMAAPTGNGRNGGDSTSTFVLGGDPKEELEAHTGMIGTMVLNMFTEKFGEGLVGSVFSEFAGSTEEVAEGNSRGGRGSDEDFGGGGDEFSNSPEFDSSSEEQGFDSMAFAEGGRRQGRQPEESPVMGFGDEGLAKIRPGLTYLGAARSDDLLEKAREAGVDAYFQFDVAVRENPANKVVTNKTSVRLILTATGASVGRSSEKIDNTAIYKDQQRDIDTTQKINGMLAGLFKVGMTQLALKPMPQLNEQQVMSRLGSLIVDPPANPLHALAEVRLYQSQGLLDDEQVHLAFDLLMGDDGLVLAEGAVEDQHKQLDEDIPRFQTL